MASVGERDRESTLSRWRKKVAVNVKGKKRHLGAVEEENSRVTMAIKGERGQQNVQEHRRAFRTIDNEVQNVHVARKGAGHFTSKSCNEELRRKVGIVPPQAAKTVPKPDEPYVKEEKDDFSTMGHIPAKRSRRTQKPAFAVPAPMAMKDHTINLTTLGWEIDTLMKLPDNVEDIDKDTSDYLMHPEYHSDIINYLTEIEEKYAHRSIDFLETGDVTAHMRTILVDWIVQVQIHLLLLDETIHLTVALIDRFLSQKQIQLSKFQLLGISCLFVAAKYTERFAPEIATLVHLTDNTYNYQQVLEMEITILGSLKFDLSFADPYQFLERYLKAAGCRDDMVRFMCMYFIDLSLLDEKCIVFRPSKLAAASVCLARHICEESLEIPWNDTVRYYSSYWRRELVPCMGRLARAVVNAPQSKYKAIQDKYRSNSQYNAISQHELLQSSEVLVNIVEESRSTERERQRKERGGYKE